jgi:hypothetical protein
MTTRIESLTRPKVGQDTSKGSSRRAVGFAIAAIGLLLAIVTLVANIGAASDLASDPASSAQKLAWSFGLTTTAFGTLKLAIGIILTAILIGLWLRVDSVEAALPRLKAHADPVLASGDADSAQGPIQQGSTVPAPLPIHTMAKRLWAPMLAMGYMFVLIGLAVSFVWADDPTDVAASAWTQGLQFLGEGFLLAGISFLLGTILASLREGGGRVQASLGLTVKTLRMPTAAKAFIALMMLGLMTSIAQFVLYVVVASGVDNPAAWFAWLGPLREVGLGLLLAGIVLALVTIGNVLTFQFDRIRQIIATGN